MELLYLGLFSFLVGLLSVAIPSILKFLVEKRNYKKWKKEWDKQNTPEALLKRRKYLEKWRADRSRTINVGNDDSNFPMPSVIY